MKGLYLLIMGLFVATNVLHAQDVVPTAKTKAERKAENKKKSLKQKIEDTLPVQVDLPKAPSLDLPGDNKISNVDDAKKFLNETLPNISGEAKKKAKKLKGKLKKDGFNGRNYEKIAVQKKIVKRGSGTRLVYQEFYILKDNKPASMYNRTLWWYDIKNRKIVEAITRDTRTNILLHGPFKEYRGENLMSEGYYYMGAKHGRWTDYDKDFNLVNKEYYVKGYFADSEIKYFGTDSSKIAEVTSKSYGKTTGQYYKFYDDGTIAEEGKYDNSKKVGKWIEYHKGGNRRKKETQYPNDYYDEKEPFVLREYDEKGKMIFEAEKL